MIRSNAKTNAQRQQLFRDRSTAKGWVRFHDWLPEHAVADFRRAAELVRDDPSLTIGRLKDRRSGRLKDQI